MDNSRQIEFFNLNNDGDSAIVRLLHSKVETIESASIHRISVDGKYKNVKCTGEGCPICGNELIRKPSDFCSSFSNKSGGFYNNINVKG